MSKTPRTDANAMGSDRVSGYDRDVVFADFARELETELAASKRLVVEKCGTCVYWGRRHDNNHSTPRRKICTKLRNAVYVADVADKLFYSDESFCCIFWHDEP